MPLATREVELIIIARDRASASIARIGGAMVAFGAMFARVGAAGVSELAEMTMEAIEFRRQIALAFTQAEISGLKYEDVLKMVRNAARQTSVPIEQLQATTFDIFSTLQLDNIEQAEELLNAFAKSAVAGQADIQPIARATMAWLNALDMEPTLANANRILDVQFELVRKGVGTYDEFAAVIGRTIPAYVNANQTVETLGGTMAFLTRNGLNAAAASVSAARGVELLFSPKAIKNMRNMGIRLMDSSGGLLQIDEVIGQLIPHFSKLDDVARRELFKDIFGTGSIQARRFFDLVLQEDNFQEFLFLLDEVRGSAGSVNEAFDIMTQEPAVQLEFLRNQIAILRQELGDQFIPFMTGKLIPLLDKVLDWWFDLSDEQKKNIANWLAFAAIFTTIAGTLTAVVGAGILLVALIQSMGTSFAVAAVLGGGVVGIIAAIAGAIALAIVDWELFKDIFKWDEVILPALIAARDWIETNWPGLYTTVIGALQNIKTWIDTEWPLIWGNFTRIVEREVDFFEDIWNTRLKPIFEDIADSSIFTTIIEEISETFPEAVGAWVATWELFKGVFNAAMIDVQIKWAIFGRPILIALEAVIRQVGASVRFFLSMITVVFGAIGKALQGDWEGAWMHLRQAPQDALDYFTDVVGNAQTTFGQFNDLGKELGIDPSGVRDDVTSINNELTKLQNKITTTADAAARGFGRVTNAAFLMVGNIAAATQRASQHLNRISPYYRDSPSLLDNVQSGWGQIAMIIDRQLRNVQKSSRSTLRSLDASLGPLTGAPSPLSRIPVVRETIPGDTQPAIGQQNNFGDVMLEGDVEELTREMLWRVMNS